MTRSGLFLALVLFSTGCSQQRSPVATTPPPSADNQSVPTPGANGNASKAATSKSTKPVVNDSPNAAARPDSIQVGAEAVSPKELGVAFYPGSKVSAKGSAHSIGKGQETFISTRTTPDPPSKVSAFYKPLFTNPSFFQGNMNMEEMCSISSFLPNGDEISIVARQPEGEDTVIVISRKKKS